MATKPAAPHWLDDPRKNTAHLRKPVGLVACGKSKLSRPAPARELYTGTLFKLSVQWLLPRVDEWAILSARHGVVLPDQIVKPYEQTLVGASEKQLAMWNAQTQNQLLVLFPARRFLVISGRDYLGALGGLDYEEAFEGLPIGRKLGALTRALNEGVPA